MEQTINFLTERERQLDDIDKAIRDTEYPPLHGKPTLEDLAGLLKGAAATIEELADQVDENENNADQVDENENNAERCEELQEAINDAVEKLDAAADDLEDWIDKNTKRCMESDALAVLLEIVQNFQRFLLEIRSDLRRV